MNFDIASSAAIHNTAQSWSERVVKNGGIKPSGDTVRTLSNFMCGLDNDNLTTKMKVVMCFVPDNLIAALTPLIVGGGRDPWLNSGAVPFTVAHLTKDGLIGATPTASGRYLKTGFNSSMYNNTSSCGLTLYNTTATAGNQIDFGEGVAVNHVYMAIDYSGIGVIFDCLTNTTPRLQKTNTGYTGYTSGNKTSPTVARIDQAKSTLAYNTFASQSNATGLFTSNEMYAYDINPVQVASSKRFSFMALHDGLSFDDGSKFYNLVQTMRQQLGGGWI